MRPATADPSPTARRILSGVANALFIARRIQAGLAANSRPSSTNRIPTPMRKSANAMDLIRLYPRAGVLARLFSEADLRPASKDMLLHRGEPVRTQNGVRTLRSAFRRAL